MPGSVRATAETPRGNYAYTQRFDESSCIGLDAGRETDEAVVLDVERAAIGKRRARTGRSGDYTGLALSGGGIRSASFCLGVLQALDTEKCIERFDYLSTVSGGGYIGCCLTATMNASGGRLAFNQKEGGFGDTEAISHIRDFSNYLIPRGRRDVITAVGLVARGWAANAALLLPMMLFFAVLLAAVYPDREALRTYGAFSAWIDWLSRHHVPFIPRFPFTTAMLAIGVGVLLAWALRKSFKVSASKKGKIRSAELNGGFVSVWRVLFGLTLFVAWLELQPLALDALSTPVSFGSCAREMTVGGEEKSAPGKPTETREAPRTESGDVLRTCFDVALKQYLTTLTPLLSPLAAIVAFLSRNLNRAARPDRSKTWSAFARRFSAKLALITAAIILPSLIWLAYLELALLLQGSQHLWLLAAFAVVAFLVFSWWIDPNATSLHRFYRDRLAKAFLFNPEASVSVGEDREQIDPKLHELDTKFMPFPIINAALNIEGSAFANKRGRDADFFEFSPEFVGSEATGWLGTAKMETAEPKLDLGTAMAISGAAFSPNMGSATIKPLVPTLALLNLRLGFWLRNPKRAADKRKSKRWQAFLLLKEIFSRITENSPTVYLTDGGNIENLGLHALLRRRCKLIVAVDAEADPNMTFGSFLKLQRYARIDLGVLIDLPWQGIHHRTGAVSAASAAGNTVSRDVEPHIAIGEIRYGPGEEDYGTLVYVKASVTGDESDYILDYKARNPDFPHETTGDQFFGEEQFEVYRALGFHAMKLFLEGKVAADIVADPPRAVAGLTRARNGLAKPQLRAVSYQGSQVPVHDKPRHEAGHQRDESRDDQDREIAG